MKKYCDYVRTKPLKGFEGRGAFIPGCRLERCLGPLDAWIFGCPYCGKEIREKGKTTADPPAHSKSEGEAT